MSSFVKMTYSGRVNRYLGIKLAEGIEANVTPSGMGLEVFGNPKVVLLSGSKAGEEAEGGLVKTNQKVRVTLGSLAPFKYHVIAEVNPEILEAGNVGMARVYEPSEDYELSFTLKADSEVDLAKMTWLLRLYLLD